MPASWAIIVAFVGSAAPATEQWNQFRGPGGRGIAEQGTYPATLDVEGNLRWRLPLDPGHSSPCLWDDRIYLTACTEDELATLCIDARSGTILWRQAEPYQPEKHLHPVNSAAACTPATDGERVCVYFGSLGLRCFDRDGEELWRRSLLPPANTFGTAASPVIAGDVVLFLSDSNEESALEAVDLATGATRWKKDRPGFVSGWSTPVVWQRGDAREVLAYGVWWLTAYDLEDGTELWSVPGLSDEPIVTPVTGEDLVFLSSYNMKTNPEVLGLPRFEELLEQYDLDRDGRLTRAEVEPNRSVLSRFDADGEGDHPLRMFFRFLDEDESGDLTVSEWQKLIAWLDDFQHANAILALRPAQEGKPAAIAWQFGRGVPECPSPLYYRSQVYAIANGGMVTCLDARTGELVFEGRTDARGPCYSSPVAGDGKIYAASARGVVTVLEAGATLNVLSRTDLGERIMATPALQAGTVYVRTEDALYAFGGPPADED